MLFLRIDDTHLSLLAYSQDARLQSEEGKVAAYPFEHRILRPSTSFETNLQDLRSAHPEFQLPQQMEVVVVSPITIVPLAEFEEEQSVELYHYTLLGDNEPRSARRVHYDLLPAANAVILFSIKEELCHAIETIFGEVHYVSSFTSWVKRFSSKVNTHQRRRAYLHCAEQQIDIAIYEGHHLLILNSYEVNTAADAAYYTLNVAQNLGLDLQQIPISLFGLEQQRDAIEEQISRYVRNVGVVRLSAEFNRHPITLLPNIPFDLATQILNQ